MSLEEQIKEVLFEVTKSIKIHTIDSQNSVIEVDYDKFVAEIMRLVESSACEQQ